MTRIAEITRADLPVINGWRQDRDLARQLGGPFRFVGPERDERWFDAYLAAAPGSQVRCAIKDEDDATIGVVYLTDIDQTARSAQFSIMLGEKAARGRGVGAEATRLMLAHAFDDLNLHRVWLHVLADNEAAIALYRKAGFVQEGTLRQAAFKEGAYVDLLVMAALAGGRA